MIHVGFPAETAQAPPVRTEFVRNFLHDDGDVAIDRDTLRRAVALEWGMYCMSAGDSTRYRRCALNVKYRLRHVERAEAAEVTPGEILARPDRHFRSMTGVGMQEQDVVRRNAEFDKFATGEKTEQASRTADLKSETVCPKCGSRDVDQIDEKQIRAMDEGATFYFECLKCGNKFQQSA